MNHQATVHDVQRSRSNVQDLASDLKSWILPLDLGMHCRRETGHRRWTLDLGRWTFFVVSLFFLSGRELSSNDIGAKLLAKEVRAKGWIVFSAREAKNDWDLFIMRPDGSHRQNITQTPETHETGGRFSPDGQKLLYRRIPKSTKVSHDQWGSQGQLMVANADGSNPIAIGAIGEFPWASWSPDAKQVACLSKKGIEIYDLASKKVIRKLDRKGI